MPSRPLLFLLSEPQVYKGDEEDLSAMKLSGYSIPLLSVEVRLLACAHVCMLWASSCEFNLRGGVPVWDLAWRLWFLQSRLGVQCYIR